MVRLSRSWALQEWPNRSSCLLGRGFDSRASIYRVTTVLDRGSKSEESIRICEGNKSPMRVCPTLTLDEQQHDNHSRIARVSQFYLPPTRLFTNGMSHLRPSWLKLRQRGAGLNRCCQRIFFCRPHRNVILWAAIVTNGKKNNILAKLWNYSDGIQLTYTKTLP